MNKKAKIAIGVCVPLVALGGIGGGVAIALSGHTHTTAPIKLVDKTADGMMAYLKFKFARQPEKEVTLMITDSSGSGVVFLNGGTTETKASVSNKELVVAFTLNKRPVDKVDVSFDLTFVYVEKGKTKQYTIKNIKTSFENILGELTISQIPTIYIQKGKADGVTNSFQLTYNGTPLTQDEMLRVSWKTNDESALQINSSRINWFATTTTKNITVTATYQIAEGEEATVSASSTVSIVALEPKLVNSAGETSLIATDGTSKGVWTVTNIGDLAIGEVKYTIEMKDKSNADDWISCDKDGRLHWTYKPGNYEFRLKASFNDRVSGIGYTAYSDYVTLTIQTYTLSSGFKNNSVEFCSGFSYTETVDLKLLDGTHNPVSNVKWSVDPVSSTEWKVSIVNEAKLMVEYSAAATILTDGIQLKAKVGNLEVPLTIGVAADTTYALTTSKPVLEWKTGKSSQYVLTHNNNVVNGVKFSLDNISPSTSSLSISQDGYVTWTANTTTETTFDVVATFAGHNFTLHQTLPAMLSAEVKNAGWEFAHDTPETAIEINQGSNDEDWGNNAFGLFINGTPDTDATVEYSIQPAEGETSMPSWLGISSNGLLSWDNAQPVGDKTIWKLEVVATDGLYNIKSNPFYLKVKEIQNVVVNGSGAIQRQHGGDEVDYEYFEYKLLSGNSEVEATNWSCIDVATSQPLSDDAYNNLLSFHIDNVTKRGVLVWNPQNGRGKEAPETYHLQIIGTSSAGNTEPYDVYASFVLVDAIRVADTDFQEVYYVQQGAEWHDDASYQIRYQYIDPQDLSAGVQTAQVAPTNSYLTSDVGRTGSYDPNNVTFENGRFGVKSTASIGTQLFGGMLEYQTIDQQFGGYTFKTRTFTRGSGGSYDTYYDMHLNVYNNTEVAVTWDISTDLSGPLIEDLEGNETTASISSGSTYVWTGKVKAGYKLDVLNANTWATIAGDRREGDDIYGGYFWPGSTIPIESDSITWDYNQTTRYITITIPYTKTFGSTRVHLLYPKGHIHLKLCVWKES